MPIHTTMRNNCINYSIVLRWSSYSLTNSTISIGQELFLQALSVRLFHTSVIPLDSFDIVYIPFCKPLISQMIVFKFAYLMLLFMGIDKCIVSCVYHCIIQNNCTALNIPCILPIQPFVFPQTPSNHWCFYCIYSYPFSKIYDWKHTSCSLFEMFSFMLPSAFQFHLVAYFFLSPNNIPIVWSLSIYQRASWLLLVWVIMSKAAINICVEVSMWA